MRFLQQWIFDGILYDPHQEFFILNTRRCMKPTSRSYWTKCFIIDQENVPDFLVDFAKDILYCGKAMNLLRICAPKNPLCTNSMEQKSSLLTCRLNWDEISNLEQDVDCYNFECILKCGSRFSINEYLLKKQEDESIIADLVIKKRAETIKRLEMEKLKEVNRIYEEKQKNIAIIKADYDKALQDKKTAIIAELLKELQHKKSILKVHSLKKQVIEEEALKLIDYYDNLMEKSDRKLLNIQKHIDRLKSIEITAHESSSLRFYSTTEIKESLDKSPTKESIESNSDVSFHSAVSDNLNENIEIEDEMNENIKIKEEEMFPFLKPDECLNNSICLDTINANSVEINSSSSDSINNNNDVVNETNLLTKMVRENKEAALKNKMKVMSEEMGIIWIEKNDSNKNNENCCGEPKIEKKTLSDLEKNRLKVMSSEFELNINLKRSNSNENGNENENKKRIKNFANDKVDNENFLNKNYDAETKFQIETVKDKNSMMEIIKKERNFKLDLNLEKNDMNQDPSKTSIFSRFWKSPNFEFPKPMSIDSTPCTSTSASKSISTAMISTAGSSVNEFIFPKEIFSNDSISQNEKTIYVTKKTSLPTLPDLNNLVKPIENSILIPLKIQMELIDNELLRHFFVNLKYLDHLKNFRNYFFLLDGEFSRNITEELFNKLYKTKNSNPTDLLNVKTLQNLIRNGLDSSIKSTSSPKIGDNKYEFSTTLSFKINSIPKDFDLDNPEMLGCLSLTYEVEWPLNILLPKDIVLKYNEVFKFLLKLNMVSWVLKNMFQELKLFSKQCGEREGFLILSPHFKTTQTYRHRMSHFLQTLQNYVMSEVLHPSWSVFEKNITSATNLDDLYNIHNAYVKDIHFKCLLNKRFTPVRNVIENTLAVILKFHRYLFLGSWVFDDDEGVFTHTNMKKLETIFVNFEEFVVYVFKAGQKIVKVGYQPHLLQLLDMLDINEYYSKNINYEG